MLKIKEIIKFKGKIEEKKEKHEEEKEIKKPIVQKLKQYEDKTN